MKNNLLNDIIKSMEANNYKLAELETTVAINKRKNDKTIKRMGV